jgi:hypothetical protein
MEQLHLLYKNRGYFDRYGGDVMISLLLIVLTVLVTGYSNYQSIMAEVQRNWNQHRCNPIYMPFAGVIMPQAGMSVTETTSTNFAYCIKQDASAVFSIAMMPFEFGMYLVIDFIDAVLESIMAFMVFIHWLKQQLGGIFDTIYEKIINFLIPLIETIVYLRDMIAKLNGIAITSLYTVMNIYNITVSGILNIMVVINNMLIATIAIMMALIVLALALIPTPAFPLGLSIYVAGLSILTSFVIPVIVLYTLMQVFTSEVFKTKSPKAPSVPKIKKKK